MSRVGSLRGVQAIPEPCNSNSNSIAVVSLLQDVVRRYKEAHPGNWDLLPERVAFQVHGGGGAVDGHCQLGQPSLLIRA
jgi:hypothetical protein